MAFGQSTDCLLGVWRRYGTAGRRVTPILQLDISSGDARTVYQGEGIRSGGGLSATPDGRKLIFTENALKTPYPFYNQLSLIDLAQGDAVPLRRAGAQTSALGWHANGVGIYARVQEDTADESHIEYLTVEGVRREIRSLRGAEQVFFSKDGRKVGWITQSGAQTDLRTGIVDDVGNVRLVGARTSLREEAKSEFAQGERRRLRWGSPDGTSGSGLLVLPIEYVPGQMYPLIVLVHGGPQGIRGDQALFPLYVPLMFDYWAAKGYAVLAPNYRSDGSAGWAAIEKARAEGSAFERDFEDIMSGVDEVIRLGIADPHHMGIAGHSWGGIATNWIVTHTNRFKAAIIYEGHADNSLWWGMRGSPNMSVEWMYGGPPWAR